MLSYRHAFHAGNHADIVKHLTLFAVLRYFNHKDKPYLYFDTHAGAGLYTLTSAEAMKNQEFQTGLQPLLHAKNRPALLEAFCTTLQSALPTAQTGKHYWGSPYLAWHIARPDTGLHLFEQHNHEVENLRAHLSTARRVHIYHQDGHRGLISKLPPTPRRAVILIDPSYEQKQEYTQIITTLHDATKRFATGCYLLWYPCLTRPEPVQMLNTLQQQYPEHLQVELQVSPPTGTFGMYGSGMFIINPPYTLRDELAESLAFLRTLLEVVPCPR